MISKRVLNSIFLLVILAGFVFPSLGFASILTDQAYVPNAWWWNSIKAREAWKMAKPQKVAVVAVIDGGTDAANPDFRKAIWKNPNEELNNVDDDGNGLVDDVNGWDFVDGDPVVTPIKSKEASAAKSYNHGTLVSGLINAIGNSADSAFSSEPFIKIMPLRALDDDGNGSIDSVTRAIYYAIDKQVDVINLSLVTPEFDKSFPR